MVEIQKTILLSSYAKLPANITAESIYKHLVIVAEVDMETGCIIKSECSLVTQLAREYVANIMEGYCLEDGIDPLINKIEDCYYGGAYKAIVTALRGFYAKYKDLKTEKSNLQL